jgi:hypothetical protein
VTTTPPDGGADHRDQVEQGDEQPEQQRVGDPPGDHPQVGADPGDHRGEQVAEQEAADLAEDFVADQDDPRAPGVGGQPVTEQLDPRQVGQEVDEQDHHDHGRPGRAEHESSRTQHPAGQGASPAGQQVRQLLLHMEAGVEPAQVGVLVFQYLHIVRDLHGQHLWPPP